MYSNCSRTMQRVTRNSNSDRVALAQETRAWVFKVWTFVLVAAIRLLSTAFPACLSLLVRILESTLVNIDQSCSGIGISKVISRRLLYYMFQRIFSCPARRTARLHNSLAQSRKARRLWHWAVQQISRVLRLRRRWASLGLHLQRPRIQSLVSGLERRKGILRRTAKGV